MVAVDGNTCSVVSAWGSHGSGRYPCSPNEKRRAGCRVPSPPLPLISQTRADWRPESRIESGSLQATSTPRREQASRGVRIKSARLHSLPRLLLLLLLQTCSSHSPGIICIVARCSQCPSPPTSPGRCTKSDWAERVSTVWKKRERRLPEDGVMFCNDK